MAGIVTTYTPAAQAIEAQVLAKIGPSSREWSYYKNRVASYLYEAWTENPEDDRLITYTLPLIGGVMARQRALLPLIHGMDEDDVFNDLVVHAFSALRRFDPTRGSIYSYLTATLSFRVLSLVRAHKVRTDDDGENGETQLDPNHPDHGVAACETHDLLSLLSYFDQVALVAKALSRLPHLPDSASARVTGGDDLLVQHLVAETKLHPDTVTEIRRALLHSYHVVGSSTSPQAN